MYETGEGTPGARSSTRCQINEKRMTFVPIHEAMIRVGVICLAALATCFLLVTGISDFPRAFVFMATFAICLVMPLNPIIGAATWMFGFAARYSGMGLGHSFRLTRQLLLRSRSQRH